MAVQIMRHPFSVEDYHRMRLAGILTEDDRVELIEGEVREMSPTGPQHAAIIRRLIALLSRRLPEDVQLSIQDSIQLSEISELQPDLMLLQARHDYYAACHPTADDVLLLVEVSDISSDYDREEKLPRYAHAGVPELWIIDVQRQQVKQYSDPLAGHYRTRQALEPGQTITSISLPEISLSLNELLG